ncbi:MAG: asparagine synthase (glutamine-hydrolyzing) [Bacteroidota bacterium]
MCGIVGIFNFNGRADVQLPHAVNMASAMKHRGPDDEGFVVFQNDYKPIRFFGEDTPGPVREAHPALRDTQESSVPSSVVALGHRRLSILDLSPGGHQPMCSSDSRYWIVYNGEIYNYIELRQELKVLGHHFKTESDTEVILAAYQQWGEECLPRFNGDWAIVIYDEQKNKLFVSRDRFGVKPLYYFQDEERILFSSEIKGLLAHPDVKTEANLDYLKSYLESGAKEWLKETAFTNIYRFPFAHYAKITLSPAETRWDTLRYWNMKPNLSKEPLNQERAEHYAAQYYELLKDAVRIRLRSDVPVGCALSGGLDSSSIVYIVNELSKENGCQKQVRTFSLVHTSVESQDCDESDYIYRLRDKLNLDASTGEPLPSEIPVLIDIVLSNMESPPDSMCMAGIFTLRIAKKNKFVVTMDGQGADEQLAGYEGYIGDYLSGINGLLFIPESIRLLNTFGWSLPVLIYFLKVFLVKFFYRELNIIREYFQSKKRVERYKTLNESLANSIETSLVNLIHYADSRSMYYSIESRMPFMDYRLVEFNASVPSNYKIYKGYTKYYARLAFKDKLPLEITWRRDKMGFPMPEKYWLSIPLRDWFYSIVNKSRLIKNISTEQIDDKMGLAKRVRFLNVSVFEKVFFKN